MPPATPATNDAQDLDRDLDGEFDPGAWKCPWAQLLAVLHVCSWLLGESGRVGDADLVEDRLPTLLDGERPSTKLTFDKTCKSVCIGISK